MYNYFVKIEYDGTNYVGWQNQKNGKSVQQVIEKALKKILKSKIKLMVPAEQIKEYMLMDNVQILKSKKKLIIKKNLSIQSIFFFKKIYFDSRYKRKRYKFSFKI